MATMRDVAEKAGVCVATVSRMVNNKGSVKESTRQRILAVMEELDYRPNELARSLSTSKTNMIGYILPRINHVFFAELSQAIEDACSAAGYKLIICTSDSNISKEKELFDMMRTNKVDGILMSSFESNVAQYLKYNLPIISIEHTFNNVPSVSCDNYKGGVLAARELIEGGCKRPAMFTSAPADRTLPLTLRIKGFFEECERLGYPAQEYPLDIDTLQSEDISEFDKILCEHLGKFDGLFTGDVMLAGIYRIFTQQGVKIPEDIKLIGYDGSETSHFLDISTIAQPTEQMGELATELLIRRIEGKIIPEQSILPVQLIRRNSTSPSK